MGIGLAIGTQATLITRVGRLIGPVRAALWTNLVAGVLGGAAIIWLASRRGVPEIRLPGSQVWTILLVGMLAILTIATFSFTLQRLGVTATLVAVILGQMVSAIIVDTFGWTGAEAIPLSPYRVAGLVIMAIAVVLLTPGN